MKTNAEELRVVRSALWAAYGDALGFISELTDERGLQRRLGGSKSLEVVAWRRRIGGQFGADVDLPAGCYSDDTQLRLSSSRAIRATGHFDVEAFAKVELPVWLSYSLGAGSGTKAAASSLSNRGRNWFSNFYDSSGLDYLEGGGNGAAMRVQPHVWSSPRKESPHKYLTDVLRNAICTHGHVRGIAGAALHALALAQTFVSRGAVTPDYWDHLVADVGLLTEIAEQDAEISQFWLPAWEERVSKTLREAIAVVQEELRTDIFRLREFLGAGRAESKYPAAVAAIGGMSKETRGSATKTALLASFAAWIFRDEDPAFALQQCALLVGSDTDTIATMAGALLGVNSDSDPSIKTLDDEYIRREASRMFRVSLAAAETGSFVYPDLDAWKAPRSLLDCVGLVDSGPCLAGLGLVDKLGPSFPTKKDDDVVYRWATLEFGQSVLLRQRSKLKALEMTSHPASVAYRDHFGRLEKKKLEAATNRSHREEPEPKARDLFEDGEASVQAAEAATPTLSISLDELTAQAIESGFEPSIIGRHLLHIATLDHEIELGVAYVAIVLKARKARLRRRN